MCSGEEARGGADAVGHANVEEGEAVKWSCGLCA